MKLRSSQELLMIVLLMLAQGLRVPHSDIIDYLVFTHLADELTLKEILFLVNKDFFLWFVFKCLPFNGFWDIFVVESISKIVIYFTLKKLCSQRVALLWLLFPLTLSTSFHLVKQNIAIAFFLVMITRNSKKFLFWMLASLFHLSGLLLVPLVGLSRAKFVILSVIIGYGIVRYLPGATQFTTSWASWVVITLSMSFICASRNYREAGILFIVIISLFVYKQNNIGAVRFFYYLIPVLFLVLQPYVNRLGKNLYAVLMLMFIMFNLIASPWSYSFDDNIFGFARTKYNISVIYE